MDEVPFKDVYLHALVRDKHGKKMSKSTGNVIDPLEVMGQYGTDAMRFTLTAFAAQGREIKLDEDRIEGYRHFINKLWNAARFALMHVGEDDIAAGDVLADPAGLPLAHRWILSRTAETIRLVRRGLDEYHFNEVASANYQFIWHEFCDWYLEWIKADLFSKDEEAQKQAKVVLLTVLEKVLKLMHPITPFVTEEIWSVLPGDRSTLMTSEFPQVEESWVDQEAERDMALLMDVITGIRNIRSESEVHPSATIDACVISKDEEMAVFIASYDAAIKDMTRLGSLTVAPDLEKPDDAATYIMHDIEIFVPLKGLVDVESELEKLSRERSKVEAKLKQVNGKLSNDKFIGNAPEAVIEKERDKKRQFDEKLAKIAEAEERLKKISA